MVNPCGRDSSLVPTTFTTYYSSLANGSPSVLLLSVKHWLLFLEFEKHALEL